jgi:hypothetical protein
VLVTARKFPSLGVVGSERADITELSSIETAPRHLQAVEPDDDESGDDGAAGEVLQQNILPLSDGAGNAPRRLPG